MKARSIDESLNHFHCCQPVLPLSLQSVWPTASGFLLRRLRAKPLITSGIDLPSGVKRMWGDHGDFGFERFGLNLNNAF